MSEKRIGEILIESGLLTREQLDRGLETQKGNPRQLIGQILIRLGYLDEWQLRQILDRSGKRISLEQVLVRNSLVTAEDLAIAREMSRQESQPLSRVLLNLDFVDPVALRKAIAIQYDMPFLQLGNRYLDPLLADVIKPGYARTQKIVPISRLGDTLTLATARPFSSSELKELEESLRLKISPVLALDREIEAAQASLYTAASAEGAPGAAGLFTRSDEEEGDPDSDDEVKKVTEKDSALVQLVNRIISDAHAAGASDIHIEPYPGKKEIIVRVRVDGCCSIYQRLPYKFKYAIPSRIKIMADLDIAERRKPQDGKIDFRKFGPNDVELRVATMPTVGNLEDVVIRLLSTGGPVSLEMLGLTERNRELFEEALTKPHGLALVVGPTGSGKTTTLHSGVARINTPKIKIWTAEDPVEITQQGLRQVQVRPKIGLTFASALRSFLRLDPDVIMVGEMRDLETASIAVEASLTGHLVLSTIHTNSAPETVTRLLEMGLDPFSFSDSLLVILGQRLARKLCPDCRATYIPGEEELAEIIDEFGREAFTAAGYSEEGVVLARPVGCPECLNTGYKGRVGIHELMACSEAIKRLIKTKSSTDVIRDQAVAEGMVTLKQDGILKVLQGHTDIHEIRRVCTR